MAFKPDVSLKIVQWSELLLS